MKEFEHISITLAQLQILAELRQGLSTLTPENLASLKHEQVAVTLCDFISLAHDPELMRHISRMFDRAADEMERKPRG